MQLYFISIKVGINRMESIWVSLIIAKIENLKFVLIVLRASGRLSSMKTVKESSIENNFIVLLSW